VKLGWPLELSNSGERSSVASRHPSLRYWRWTSLEWDLDKEDIFRKGNSQRRLNAEGSLPLALQTMKE
jgi:hypothetical protein